MSEENNNTYYLKLRQNMLRFAQKLETLDNVFLKDFSQYLQEIYKDDNRRGKSGIDWHMEILEDFISRIYLLPQLRGRSETKGCALFGETTFDKLDFTKAFLENYGGSKYADDGITHNRYAVVDCEGKAKKPETLEKYARQYKNVPFVIFNNCENILNQLDNLRLFKSLCDGNREIPFIDTDGEVKTSILKSWYILLGDKNKIHETYKKTHSDLHATVEGRIYDFSFYIDVFDLDKESQNI